MKKKVIFTLLLCIIVLSCTYASSFSAEVKASPYSFQFAKRDADHFSKYGFGAEIGAGYNIWEGLSAGVDIKYSNYKYDEVSDKYHVIAFTPNVGWTQSFSDKWSATAKLGAGLQFRIIGDAKGKFFALNLYLGAGYALNEKITLTAGVDLGLAFQKDSKDLSAEAMLGAKYNF